MRRTYYDHEDAYQRIAEAGGRGWDDLNPAQSHGSYDALDAFLRSELCPNLRSSPYALDVGCGGGQASVRLAQHGFVTTGVDFAPTAISLAREVAALAGADVRFEVADCLDLASIDEGTFDLVVDNHTLHCILGSDRSRFFQEVRRVLKPGGVVFSESMSAEGRPDFEALGVDPVERVDLHRTRYWVQRKELLAEFHSSGLVVQHIEARAQPETPNPGDLLCVVARKPVPKEAMMPHAPNLSPRPLPR